MRSLLLLCSLFVLPGCSGTLMSNEEARFFLAAADANCVLTSPCEFSVIEGLTAIRLHAAMRSNGTPLGQTMHWFSVSVGSGSVILERGIALGCTDADPCEFTMAQGSPRPTVLVLINKFDHEDEGTVFSLYNDRITVEN